MDTGLHTEQDRRSKGQYHHALPTGRLGGWLGHLGHTVCGVPVSGSHLSGVRQKDEVLPTSLKS